jgi:hypothetical protein
MRVRFTIRLLMLAIVVVALVCAALAAIRERQRRLVAALVADAEYAHAVVAREVSEIAAVEFETGIYPQAIASVESEIARAEAQWKAALAAGDKQAAQIAETALAQARNRRAKQEEQLREEIKLLRHEVEKAKADEGAKKAILNRAKAAVTPLWW